MCIRFAGHKMEAIFLFILCCSSAFSGRLLVSAQTSLSDADRKELLDAHNQFRRMVSPTASNMIKLEYNMQLKQIAQRHAQSCDFDHNPNRHSESSEYQNVGENIYASALAIDYTAAVEVWYNEGISAEIGYDFGGKKCGGSDPTACLHYTQLVWADTEAIGCGVYKCTSVSGLSFDNAAVLVCNYGPSGNINLETNTPYLAGEPCSQCPSSHPFCEDKLCTRNGTNSLGGAGGTTDQPDTIDTGNSKSPKSKKQHRHRKKGRGKPGRKHNGGRGTKSQMIQGAIVQISVEENNKDRRKGKSKNKLSSDTILDIVSRLLGGESSSST